MVGRYGTGVTPGPWRPGSPPAPGAGDGPDGAARGGAAADADVAARIARLTDRVFGRLERWARRAAVGTIALALITWIVALIAFRRSSWWGVGPSLVVLAALCIPAVAAWLLLRRARTVRDSVAGLETEIVSALRNPDIAGGLRSFLGDDVGRGTGDGRAGLARLAKGAFGIRAVVREHRQVFGDLAAAVRAMLTSPAMLVVIGAGTALVAGCLALFLLIAIF